MAQGIHGVEIVEKTESTGICAIYYCRINVKKYNVKLYNGLKVSVVAYLPLNLNDYIYTFHLELLCGNFEVNTETET